MSLNYGDEKEVYWRTAEWAVQYPSIFPVYTKDGFLGCNSYLPGFENYNTFLDLIWDILCICRIMTQIDIH